MADSAVNERRSNPRDDKSRGAHAVKRVVRRLWRDKKLRALVLLKG